MKEPVLTSDNPLLSEPSTASKSGVVCAINCTVADDRSPSVCRPQSEAARRFIELSLAQNTRRAYASDFARFIAWGGQIPSSENIVADYLAEHSSSHSVATLARWLASIAKAHRSADLSDPTRGEIVKATLRGIRRELGAPSQQVKPLLKEDLFATLDCMSNNIKDVRDQALLLLGFAGALRRSELVNLNLADIEHVRLGIVITIPRSKTDQIGTGRKIGIPFGRTRWCPVKHLSNWLVCAQVESGRVFRPVDRHGHISGHHLSGEAVAMIVKQRVEAAGLDPSAYSGHSLRAGLATSAVIAGVNTLSIRRTTGHASDAMLARYVRVADLFTDNAAGAIL